MAHDTEPDREEFAEIAAYTYLADAELARQLLEAEGVPVLLRNEQFASTLPHMTNAVGGVRLTVAPEEVERAREILAAQGGEPEGAEDAAALEGDDVVVHPRDLEARRAWRAAMLGLVFFPVFLHLYSLWLVVRYYAAPGPVTAGSARRANVALALDVLVIGIAARVLAG